MERGAQRFTLRTLEARRVSTVTGKSVQHEHRSNVRGRIFLGKGKHFDRYRRYEENGGAELRRKMGTHSVHPRMYTNVTYIAAELSHSPELERPGE